MLQKLSILADTILNTSGGLHIIVAIVTIVTTLALAVITYFITKLFIKTATAKLIKNPQPNFLNALCLNRTPSIFAHIASGAVLWFSSRVIANSEYGATFNYEVIVLNKLSLLYIFIICLIIASKIVWSINSYYEKQFDFARQYPIYSYLKIVILFVWFIGIVLIISFFLRTSPWALLTGVGAVSAVLLLVFKDTLLGIISSVQATALSIVRIGDRISIDKYGVDGRVIDIAINTVKIRSDNNTITHIPTYMLTTEIIKNWRAMEESGIRHIQRAVHIDSDSIIVCSPALLQQLEEIPIVKQYIVEHPDMQIANLTLFRVFFQDYLSKHKYIKSDALTMVRLLAPIAVGVQPLEIFAYTTKSNLVKFELIQAEIFEHLFSMLPFFSLKIYHQN